MANIFIATLPASGHVNPMLAIARTLTERGNTVRWYCAKPFASKIEYAEAKLVEMQALPHRGQGNGNKPMARFLRWLGFGGTMVDWNSTFIDPIEGQVCELEAALEAFPADVLLSDPVMISAAIVAERQALPWAILGIMPLKIKSRDVPPFLLGMKPHNSLLGRWWIEFLHWFAEHIVFREPLKYYRAKAEQNGWAFKSFMDFASPYLHLQASVPALEYPRSDLPAQIHYIGPLIPEPEPGFVPPAWWNELAQAHKPVVLVTQGTIATDIDKLLKPALQALRDEDIIVVATTVSKTPQELGLEIPKNARVEQFIPFANLMPYVSVCVTNGGFGGVSLALANGVPVIVAGITEEKPEVANRVEYARAGINLRTATPSRDQIRNAVRKVLSDQRYHEGAMKIQAQGALHDPPTEAAILVEQLSVTRQPVLRTQVRLSLIDPDIQASVEEYA